MEDTQTIILVTGDCNQNCVFCSGEQSGADREAQSDEEILKLIKN